MNKIAVTVILLVLFAPLLAQDMPFNVKNNTKYSTSTMVGKVAVDSLSYYQIRLIQEFKYKKFGIGLDLDFLFDEDYHLRESDWDHFEDILNKFYYFRYAELDDPYFFHFGGFPNRSVGNGLVMLNYSNMHYYPDLRNQGLLIGGSFEQLPLKPRFELFSSNITKNDILSFTTNVKPLPDSTLKHIDQTILGFSVFTDRNQNANLHYVLGDSLYQALNVRNSDSMTALSFDITLPVSQNRGTTFGTYAEIAHVVEHGTGFILPGIYGDYKNIRVNLEYRMHGKSFTPGLFGHFYEEERAILETAEDGTQSILTKEEALRGLGASYGFYGKVQGTIGKRIKSMIAWQNMYGKELKNGKSLWFSLNVDSQYKRLERFSLSYSKINVEKLSLGKIAVPSARLSTTVTLSLNDKRRWFFVAKYSEKYKDKEGDIKWWKDTKRSFGLGVKYSF